MRTNLGARALLPFIVVITMAGSACNKPAPSGSTSAASTSSAVSTATRAAHVDAPASVTTAEVQMRDKRKVAFSIELPEGLKDVSESPLVKQYAKEAKKYDGYSFQVMEANPKWAAAGLDMMVAEAEKSPDAIKNKAKILDKGKTDDGWYLASSIEEGPTKKAVILMSLAKTGDVSLMCRGNVEGPLADQAEASAAVLVKACKSLKIAAR